VEIGGAGLPVLAPMAVPAAGAGAGGGWTLECVVGEYEQAFTEFGDATGLINDGAGENAGGCGQAGATCLPTTTKYKFQPVCSPWSPSTINITGLCTRDRNCQTKTLVVTIKSDCSTIQHYEYGSPYTQSQSTPALTRPDGSKYCP